ncbi:MAG: hypothetical protein WCB53_08915 [Terriglobales bacterium]|jgi:hypothetical protein
MKTKNGSHRQTMQVQAIAPGLVLGLLLYPFGYAVGQQSPSQDPFRVALSQTPSAQVTKPQLALAAGSTKVTALDNDNAPVPPMPPLDPAEAATPSTDSLPDSPGAIESAQLETQQPSPTQPSAQQTAQQETSQTAAEQPPAMPKEPLGTAAAETVPTMGIAGSRPAGAALAPAKQRRVRTILIRTGAIVGAAAAVGLTMALTEASPSKPPGAR